MALNRFNYVNNKLRTLERDAVWFKSTRSFHGRLSLGAELTPVVKYDCSRSQKLCCCDSGLPVVFLELDCEVDIRYPATLNKTTPGYCFCIVIVEATIT